ncbi:uncharacterized protein LOC111341140 [Stylophora pistillata]|nr:uncharacterized protein LOC111341140 [Stylophora pistillata]
MEKIELFHPFYSFDECNHFLEILRPILEDTDPVVALLALEGLYRVENEVRRCQFTKPLDDLAKAILRKWRNESSSFRAYAGVFKKVPNILKSLTIFKTLEVPLFVDDYGKKRLLSSYGEEIQNVVINENTEIAHVTHSEEAKSIKEAKELKGSERKNIVTGCWFGLWDAQNPKSVYGSKAFTTTLNALGVRGLDQGEIVEYKNEVNVILYATNDEGFDNLKKPTDQAVKSENENAYVKVSIFVPTEFLPKNGFQFMGAIRGPFEVSHDDSFCVREKRERDYECPDRD